MRALTGGTTNIVTGSSSSYENEDLRPSTKTKSHYENEEPLRKRRPPAKTKTPCENEDSLRNPPTYENEDLSRKRRHITKTSSKEVGITIVYKDYVHETHYENEDPYRNLEFWIWHVCNFIRNISTVEPHEAFNGTTLKLKRLLLYCWSSFSWGGGGLRFRNGSSFS